MSARTTIALSASLLAIASTIAVAQQLNVDLNRISDQGVGDKVGTATISTSGGGVSLKVDVKGVPPGRRGFHVHENGDCGPGVKDGKMAAGIAAGEHYDPAGTGKQQGPGGDGHRGDLPYLTADEKGTVSETVKSERLKLADLRGRALVIHEGGDNYTDTPESGGGGARIVCGVIPK